MAKPISSRPATLEEALRDLLSSGLPLIEATAQGSVLPNQRCVYAHAQHPHELASRITATNRLLRDLLKGFGSSPRATASRILFGAARNLRGTSLTYRREEAAGILERHPDHFRKHIEPKIVGELAFAIHEQNLRYTPATAQTRPPLAAHEDTPVITEDSFTEQEELLCRVWSAVYGYRGELVAVQRRLIEAREGDRDPDADLQEHISTATWQLARLLTFVSEYLERYGETILQGDTEFNIEGLVQMAGWHGGLGSDEAKRLRLMTATAGVHERAALLRLLHDTHA